MAASRRASARRCWKARIYDANGQLVTASFMDYTMPRADDLPSFKMSHHEHAVPVQSARHQGLRRGRRDRLAACGHQRHHRRHRQQ
jgi:hypothetical protein